MPKKCKLGFILKFIFLNCVFTNAQDIAMFSDNFLNDFSSVFSMENGSNSKLVVDSLFLNQSLLVRFESNKYCASPNTNLINSTGPSSTSILNSIIKYSNYSKNSFESKSKYHTCEQIIEYFCNPSVTNKILSSHSTFDCEDYLKADRNIGYIKDDNSSSNIYVNGLKLVNLSPSVRQIEIVLTSIMNRFSLSHYAIVYADTNYLNDIFYFKKFSANLVYKFSIDSSFTLDFSLPLNDSKIDTFLTPNVKSN